MKTTYDIESLRLAKAIDIAITAFEKFPPKDYTTENLKHSISVYEGWKDDCLNPNQKFRNLNSLKYIIQNCFTFFQEGSGTTVEFFWQEIKKQNLGYKRENKLEKIIKRGKIKNRIEYDFVIDVLLPYQNEDLISDEQVKEINKMISDFEIKFKK